MYDICRFVGCYGYDHFLYRSYYYLKINGFVYCSFLCTNSYDAWLIQAGKYKCQIFRDIAVHWGSKYKKAELILHNFHVYEDRTIYMYNTGQIDKVLSISIVHM